MSIEAMKMALETLERLDGWLALRYGNELTPPEREVVTALRQAIEQAEQQEPVGYVTNSGKSAWILKDIDLDDDTPIYTAPPKREWVGLTDEEIDLYALDIGVTANKAPLWLVKYVRDIEAKLKKKNS